MVQTEKMLVVSTSKICHGQKKMFFILSKKEKFMAICICIMGAEKNGLKNLFMFFRANQTTQKSLKLPWQMHIQIYRGTFCQNCHAYI